jgi:acetyl-CoA carboxylase biotin carboxylase subunit
VEPGGPGVRVDSGVYPGWNVPLDYDPMLAKLIAWSGERSQTIARMRRAIDEYRISGIRTNLSFFKRLLADREFQEGKLDTGFLDRFFSRSPEAAEPTDAMVALAAAAAHHHATLKRAAPVNGDNSISPWLIAGRDQLQR